MNKKNKEFPYKFSIILPIYNVESFIKDAVESIMEQDIGFDNNIEIIFVNDGSSDRSEEVCLDFINKHPNNMKYIYQENAGVSCARNAGLRLATGKYINFLDPDDKWSKHSFSEAYRFLEKHEKEIDFVACLSLIHI